MSHKKKNIHVLFFLVVSTLSILEADGVRGLYHGFGVSVLTYAASSAAWWAWYAMAQRLLWRAVGPAHHNSRGAAMAVQGASAAAAGARLRW